MKPEEKELDINHLSWIQWLDWIYELSKCKYGVQLGTASAGTFNMNCAYLGIPCIGYDNVNPQYKLHPNLSVPEGDVEQAKNIAIKLKSDKDFYTEQSRLCKENFIQIYSEEKFKEKICNFYGVHDNQLYLCDGSDSGIKTIFESLTDKGRVITSEHSFPMYKVYSNLNSCEDFGIPHEQDYTISIEKILSNITY